jgi:hypothetical protein
LDPSKRSFIRKKPCQGWFGSFEALVYQKETLSGLFGSFEALVYQKETLSGLWILRSARLSERNPVRAVDPQLVLKAYLI